jgi:hypothetical protein
VVVRSYIRRRFYGRDAVALDHDIAHGVEAGGSVDDTAAADDGS